MATWIAALLLVALGAFTVYRLIRSWRSALIILPGALRERGVKEPAASLAAEAGIAAFRIAFERWVSETRRRDLPRLISASLAELKGVLTGTR